MTGESTNYNEILRLLEVKLVENKTFWKNRNI